MVRAHGRRAGISSVDRVESQSVSAEQDATDGSDGIFLVKPDGTVVSTFYNDGSFNQLDLGANTALSNNGTKLVIRGNRTVASAPIDMADSPLQGVRLLKGNPRDVRNDSNPDVGDFAYHDGSGSNTEGVAQYTSGGVWESVVDGTTIS